MGNKFCGTGEVAHRARSSSGGREQEQGRGSSGNSPAAAVRKDAKARTSIAHRLSDLFLNCPSIGPQSNLLRPAQAVGRDFSARSHKNVILMVGNGGKTRTKGE